MNATTRTVPATMSAMVLTGHGGPEKLVYRTDVKVPVPASDEVLVKVSACGMNNTDVWVRQGCRTFSSCQASLPLRSAQ